MGTTHFRSNIVAKGKTITANTVVATTLTGNTSLHVPTVTANAVTATTLTGNTSVTAPLLHSSGRIKIGDHQYIFISTANTAATIVAEATAVDASVKGSMTLSSAGSMWLFTADNAATKVK